MPPQKFNVGLIQMSTTSDPDRNLQHAIDKIHQASARGAHIVCLPELFQTQYFCQREDSNLFDLAQPIPEKPKKASKKNPGTPAYMAPEQLLGQPITHRVDIFSFGVAAYELLTNQKPFPGDTPGEILKKQMDRADFVPPRQYNPDMPAALEKVILRCLEREPERRYPFMGVMGRELKAALYV